MPENQAPPNPQRESGTARDEQKEQDRVFGAILPRGRDPLMLFQSSDYFQYLDFLLPFEASR
jgi:hypothetical protein